MSDTPRTDYEIEVNQLDRFEADWPRKLERECDRLAKQCVKNVEEIGQLRIELAVSKKDAARLEWLIDGINDNAISPHVLLTREGIDKAMEAAQS